MGWGWIAGGALAVIVGSAWWLGRDRLYRTVMPRSMPPEATASQRLRRFWFNVVAVGLVLWGVYVVVFAIAER
jgi:hypothetical protein